ncbi:hypothetical protein HPT25_04000 [Bacillus sp. BRMEA1]|uniref:hypothetical protein n=1 Tax=Neobacillus endophyticus TaxID=2738405 RepID=UPI0015658280|nr:hypothetical protein [Neobacillus endophyticus]NRD76652.1 hypothetical protein [Neobacillus endophyticus]
MSFPKRCIFCGADKNDLFGWIKNDYLKTWECKKCGKKWEREFDMSGKIYYQMLENLHVIINRKEVEQHNFWKQEVYTEEDDFKEAGLTAEYLLAKGLCRRETRFEYLS